MKKILYSILCTTFLALSACTPATPAIPTATPAKTLLAVSATLPPTSIQPTSTPPAATPSPSGEKETLTILTHDSFSASEGVIAAFEQQNNVKLSFIKGGDVAATLNRAILSKGSPLADVIYGIDNTFLSRAEHGDILESYASPRLADIPDEFKLSKEICFHLWIMGMCVSIMTKPFLPIRN